MKSAIHEKPRINIDVILGAAPLLETRLVQGLLDFGRSRSNWRFSMRSADFRYTPTWFQNHALDGVLILIDGTHVERALKTAAKPVVKLVPSIPSAQACVTVDDVAIGRMGAEFLLGKGFLKCTFFGVGTTWSQKRYEGFSKRLNDAGLSCGFIDIPFDTGHTLGLRPDAEKRIANWLKTCKSGSAVMAAHDALANRLVDACQQKSIRVPQDLAILGVGNHELLCELCPVPISSIDAAIPIIAMRGAELLEKTLIRGQPCASICIPPIRIVERRSTAITTYGDNIVAKVIDYIHLHIQNQVTIEDLLQAFPISRRTLDRRFAKYTGHSPAMEIRLARLQRARELVNEGHGSLSEIAQTCGYADLSHMDRVFKKTFGQTPQLMRRKSPAP